MMRRHWVWIPFVAMLLRIVAPVAAYASAAGVNELCSAYAKASPANGALPGAPESPQRQHLLSHCPDCPGGTAAAVLPAACVAPLLVATGVVLTPPAPQRVPAAEREPAPLPRGPPPSLSAV